ncbi:MAG: hypothetical protein EP350_03445 [Alphaproteobacteria bacterium]|nr:MAG: hypothetical protein EP350_03445 [Alphaproteobacteria bacterium]
MQRQLLICAAFDLSGASWPERAWDRMVASLKLGKAGDIRHCMQSGAAFAQRADALPGSDRPGIMPLELEPDADGIYTILAGRLLERRFLADRLSASPQLSDAELYAAAFRCWGERCDTEIVGEYAAVQWFPDRANVRLARSPLIAPPLYVWRNGSRLIAASLPRTIFASGVELRLDPHRIADVALFNFGDGSRSYYRGLSRVPCGSRQHHDLAGERSAQFWNIGRVTPQVFSGDQDYLDALNGLLDRAVCANIEGAVSPALQLSGGLDSQAVAASLIARLPQDQRVRSYTAVPIAGWVPKANPRLIYDESARVHAFAEMHPQLDPVFLTGEEAEFGADIDAMALLSGCPGFNEMNMHWLHGLYRKAAGDGKHVLLDGEFGDAAFSYDGMTGYPTWLKRGKWAHLLRELNASPDQRPLWRKALSLAAMPHLPFTWRRRIDELRGLSVSPLETWCPLDPNSEIVRGALARAEADGNDPWMYAPASAAKARVSMLAAAQSEGGEIALGLRLLHGVETRSPLAFRPLVEFCSGVPDEQYLRNGMPRSLARRLLKGRIPDEIVEGRQNAIQSADFLGRVARDRGSMLRSLARIGDGSLADSVIDLPRIRQYLEMHEGTEVKGADHWLRMTCAVPRGIALARFVQFVEGSNDG